MSGWVMKHQRLLPGRYFSLLECKSLAKTITPLRVVSNLLLTDRCCPSLPRLTAESVSNRLKTDAEIRVYPRVKGMVDTVLKEWLIS